MVLLITNDDGIESPGLTALREELEKKHTVYVSAPVRDRSGISHAISLNDPMRIKRISDKVYTCSGYPADCVLTACLDALPARPDCVLSGINIGANLGTDLLYSGTAAAARQASIMGKPGIAISIASFHPPFFFEPALRFIDKFLDKIVACWVPGFFLNINVPNLNNPVLPINITTLAELRYRTALSSFQVSKNEAYHFFKASLEHMELIPGTDIAAIKAGCISVTAVANLPKQDKHCEEYGRLFGNEGV